MKRREGARRAEGGREQGGGQDGNGGMGREKEGVWGECTSAPQGLSEAKHEHQPTFCRSRWPLGAGRKGVEEDGEGEGQTYKLMCTNDLSEYTRFNERHITEHMHTQYA